MNLREHRGELIVLRCWCGVQHAVPQSLRDEQMRLHDNKGTPFGIYCPLGHSHIPSGESLADKHRREMELAEKRLAAERARHDQTRADRDHIEACRRAEKAAKTRLKKRIGAGVCPCCKRSFQNLARHMKGQHPEFAEDEEEG